LLDGHGGIRGRRTLGGVDDRSSRRARRPDDLELDLRRRPDGPRARTVIGGALCRLGDHRARHGERAIRGRLFHPCRDLRPRGARPDHRHHPHRRLRQHRGLAAVGSHACHLGVEGGLPGLTVLALAPSSAVLFAGWAIIGLGMGSGLYEAAFSTLAGIYGREARGPITGITLIAGFASTVGWPLSGLMLATWGWREACLGWAAIHLLLALPLNALLPSANDHRPAPRSMVEDGPPPSRVALALLAFVFAATWFTSTAMAAHLPGLLQAAGASTAVA